nr:hypothetical protein BaRGS_004843 [Batillaria attramentaria]
MLGYTGGVPTAKRRAHYGEGRGRILLDDVSCRGTETDLMDCDHNDIGDENCDHDEDVGVDCQPRDQIPLEVRLVGGASPSAGRVELRINGKVRCTEKNSWCKIPGLDNDTYAIQNEAHEVLVSETIPVDKDGAYDDCQMYTDSEGKFGNGTYACHAWVYDRSDFVSTVITQFDLVCDKREFRAHFNMAYMLGVLVGSSTTGFLCDKFGRKPVFFISVILSMVVGTVSAYPGMIEILITLRFLLGLFGTGVYLALYVLTMEFVGPSKRTLAGSLMMVIWLVGPYLVGAISFGVRDWRYIQLLSSLPLIFSIGFWWAVVAMTYYGLSLNVDNLVGNVRVNFMLSNTVELWLTTALAMVGKLCVSGAFSVIYLITAELYPTVLRNFGMGCSSTVARVGSAVSPYIADLGVYVGGQFGKALPLIIFGAFAVTAGGLSLILPETLNRKLPDTIEDAASFGGMHGEDVVHLIGEWGPYQLGLFLHYVFTLV